MKNIFFFLVLIFCINFYGINTIQGQTASKNNSFTVGFNISQYQKDYGLGLHVLSPSFAQEKMAVKLGANLQWLEYNNGREVTWDAYGNFQIGLRSKQTIVENRIFVYGEGGAILLFPNDNFSTKEVEIGGYGLFGFEFKTLYSPTYFLELGGLGTGAKADKVESSPIYSNGFLMNVGIRFSL